MSHNRLTGGLEPLSGCKELLGLDLYDNRVHALALTQHQP